ncbi:MAG: HD domain-containing protein, partial [Gammaproteobacteria bacterium]|nr:HD domain-containing protein [Gammaproteobacteria bacterium]
EFQSIRSEILDRYNFLSQIDVCLHDSETDKFNTYTVTSDEVNLGDCTQKLKDSSPYLQDMASNGKPLIINNIEEISEYSEPIKIMQRSGYQSSYTVPMQNNQKFLGFIFFNSHSRDLFSSDVTDYLDMYGRLITHKISGDLQAINALNAAVKTMKNVFGYRDPETGEHLNRMSHYSWLLARKSADKHSLHDSWVEDVLLFSPLHDVGKIAISEDILFKPGKLTAEEFEIIKTHTSKGREMIDNLVNNFGLNEYAHIDILKNIVEFHHESVDGSGYPLGLSMNDIPLEARIVAVADVFDALTSERPYKTAMSNDDAIEILRSMSGKKLDSDLVETFIECIDEVETYQKIYRPKPSESISPGIN